MSTIFSLIQKLQFKLLIVWYSKMPRRSFNPENLPGEPAVLVAAPLYLGDLCMALPALARLKQSMPNQRIILLVRPELEALAKLIIGIDHVISFYKNTQTLRSIRAFKVSLAICFFEKRLFQIVRASGARKIWAFRDHDSPRFIHGPCFEKVSALPIAEMLDFLVIDFLDYTSSKLRSPVRRRQLTQSFWNLSSVAKQRLKFDCERYAVIHLSGRGEFRRIDFDTAAELKNNLIEAGITPVFTGTGDRLPAGLELNAISLIDKTSLPELLLILARSELVFGPDTGVTHLAASLGVRTVVIMGSSQPRLAHSELFFPNRIFQYSGELACRSTKRLHGYAEIPNGHCKGFQCRHKEQGFCIKGINQQIYMRLAKEEIHKTSAKWAS